MQFSDLILYNDHHLVACSKPPGAPTQEDRSGDPSLHRMAQAYCKRDLFVVHRLDRPCSGVVLFAKNKKAAAALSEQFAEMRAVKTYIALVSKGIEPAQGTLTHRLERSSPSKVKVVEDESEGKLATLDYKVIGELDNYAVLQVTPGSGRMHQIRAQLAAHGFPIKGDVKYGARRGNRNRSIDLHALRLEVVHPTKGEKIVLEAAVPDDPVWKAVDFS